MKPLRFVISERSGRPVAAHLQTQHGGDPGLTAFVAPEDCHQGRPGRTRLAIGDAADFHRLGIRLARERRRAANIRVVKGA